MITLEAIEAMQKALDDNNVPEDDRKVLYYDINGNQCILDTKTNITDKQIAEMPEHLRALFL